MKTSSKIVAGIALAIGFAASPSFAQNFNSDSSSYNRDGTLNVWGAHIDPPRSQGGLLGGVGNVVGGVTGAVGGVVGGTVGAADDIVTGTIAPRRGDRSARYEQDEQNEEMMYQDRGSRRGAAY
ncbi:hypothetical protein [Methylobacterium sp. V23]|uniref:hypothetical protein n=1 Tax=Methylobacterium sp. V23 TaxID=2044878 RepID=UPI0015E19510|nr:hypothetical protein [Methylobacterium sp. V23]